MLLWTLGCTYLFKLVFSFSPDVHQEWNCWIIWWLYFCFFEKHPYCFPWWLHQLTSYQQCIRIFFSLHPLQKLLFPVFLTIAILTGMRWHLILICISLVIISIGNLFICYLDLLLIFGFFFFYAWLYELFLYFGSIAPFANIFSHSVCCSFCWWLSLLCKNVNFHLLIFNLYFYCSWKQIQKYIAVIYVSVLPMFSSRGFIVSSLILRSLIHSEFTFVYGIRKCSNFILLNISVQFPQHHLLKILSFLHCMFLPPLW